jgi:RNA polymerase sigma-70 factor (ECF subfamily)
VNKDRSVFEFLYDSYSPPLHGSIIDLMADKEIAANVLQKAFVSAYFTISDHKRPKQKLYVWMLHIALRLTIQTLQVMEKWPTASQLEKVSGDICSILSAMDTGPRVVISLIYDKGLSKHQVAKRLRIPMETVDEWLAAGMRQLQGYLNNYEWK